METAARRRSSRLQGLPSESEDEQEPLIARRPSQRRPPPPPPARRQHLESASSDITQSQIPEEQEASLSRDVRPSVPPRPVAAATNEPVRAANQPSETDMHQNVAGATGQDNTDHSGEPSSTSDWILRVRDMRTSRIVQFFVVDGMDPLSLGNCILQAFGDSVDLLPSSVVGLFRERDAVFFSLDHMLKNPEIAAGNVIFALWPTFHRPTPPIRPWWQQKEFIIALVGFLIFIILVIWGPGILDATAWAMFHLWKEIFDIPLRELYRYGPSLVGWEGMPMSEVCARITYFGDRDFWSRNLEDCRAVYASKEEAFLRVARPFLYIILSYLVFVAIRHLVETHSRNQRRPMDQDMVDTYRAFQVLLRQTAKAFGKSNPGHPHRR